MQHPVQYNTLYDTTSCTIQRPVNTTPCTIQRPVQYNILCNTTPCTIQHPYNTTPVRYNTLYNTTPCTIKHLYNTTPYTIEHPVPSHSCDSGLKSNVKWTRWTPVRLTHGTQNIYHSTQTGLKCDIWICDMWRWLEIVRGRRLAFGMTGICRAKCVVCVHFDTVQIY